MDNNTPSQDDSGAGTLPSPPVLTYGPSKTPMYLPIDVYGEVPFDPAPKKHWVRKDKTTNEPVLKPFDVYFPEKTPDVIHLSRRHDWLRTQEKGLLERMSKGDRSEFLGKAAILRISSDKALQGEESSLLMQDYRNKANYQPSASHLQELTARNELRDGQSLHGQIRSTASPGPAKTTRSSLGAYFPWGEEIDWAEEEDAPPEGAYVEQLESEQRKNEEQQSTYEPQTDQDRLYWAYRATQQNDLAVADIERLFGYLETIEDLNTPVFLSPSDEDEEEDAEGTTVEKPIMRFMNFLVFQCKAKEANLTHLENTLRYNVEVYNEKLGDVNMQLWNKDQLFQKIRLDYQSELARRADSIARLQAEQKALRKEVELLKAALHKIQTRTRESKATQTESDTTDKAPPRTGGGSQDAVSDSIRKYKRLSLDVVKQEKTGSPLAMLLARHNNTTLPASTVLGVVKRALANCAVKSVPPLVLL